MNINKLNNNQYPLHNNKLKTPSENQQNGAVNSQTEPTAKIPYYSYIANSNITFGNNKKELEEFDISQLPNINSDDEFEIREGISDTGLNLSCLTNLASQYMTEQIRAIENTDKLVPYKERNIREENRYCSEDEINALLEEEKERFVNYFEEEKDKAIKEIDKVNPTTKPHTVYRISNDFNPDSKCYFDKINALKPGEETTLDKAPIYVGTSPAGLLKTYGMAQNGVLFKINLPKGSKVAKFPSMDGINQLLMKPEAKFTVVDNQEYKNNFRVITLDYINE